MQPPQQPETFQPPLLTLTIAVALAVLARWLPLTGVRYVGEWAHLLAAASYVAAAFMVVKAWKDRDIVKAYKRKHETFDNAAGDQGRARFGDVADALHSEDFV